MKRYDYEGEMRKDIYNAITAMIKAGTLPRCLEVERFVGELSDRLQSWDSVTGNRSGRYFSSRWKAAEAVCHNLDLYEECVKEFGEVPSFEPEVMDVSIRCYLLPHVLRDMANVGDFDVFLEKTREYSL